MAHWVTLDNGVHVDLDGNHPAAVAIRNSSARGAGEAVNSQMETLKKDSDMTNNVNNIIFQRRFFILINKVEIANVNTSKLQVLTSDETKELFSSISNLIKLSLENHKTKHTTEFYE